MKQIKKYFIFKTNKKAFFLICFLFWLSIFALYFQSIQFGFVDYDDTTVLLANPNLYNENSLISSLQEILYKYFPREEPLILRDITWALDSYFFGFKNPMGYHLGNVFLNSFNVVLLFIFLFVTTQKMVFSFLVSITFGVLPVHVEPVCWVMGRKDLLVTFFMLCALITQTLFLEEKKYKKKRLLYFITLLFTIMALMSKINALIFFMVLAVHQIFYPYLRGYLSPHTSLNLKHICKKILPWFLPHLLISVYIYLWYNNILSSFGMFGRGPGSFSAEHLKNLMVFIPLVMFYYGQMIFFPFYDYSISYYRPNVNISLEPSQIAISICTGLTIICLLIITFYKRKDIFFYLITFFILMIPYCNIVYIGIWIASRYIYFSCFCILAALFTILTDKKENIYIKKIIWITCIIFIVLSSFYNYKYQKAWKDNHSLWTYENNLNDPSILSYEALAKSYIKTAKTINNSESKIKLLNKADIIIQNGLKKFHMLNFRTSNYFIPEMASHSKFYYLKGLIAEIRDNNLEKQLEYFTKAYKIYKNKLNIFMMARIYFKLAVRTDKPAKRKNNAKLSFKYFTEWIYGTNNIKKQKHKLLMVTKNYKKNFPFMLKEITQIQNYILKK